MDADPADAKRWAPTTGAPGPSTGAGGPKSPIRRPSWLDVAPGGRALPVVASLEGGCRTTPQTVRSWRRSPPLRGVERDLRKLALLDDSPVLKLGTVWKAKAPLELLDLFGDRITDGELERFFEAAKTILAEADPQLELADEDRYAAQVYGKVRPQSGLLINALCDTLMKLAVRGPAFPGLADLVHRSPRRHARARTAGRRGRRPLALTRVAAASTRGGRPGRVPAGRGVRACKRRDGRDPAS